jgi:PDZ domain
MSRLLAGLFVAVLAATSFADTTEPTSEPVATEEPAKPVAKPADTKFPLKVVKLLPESEQALLFDAKRGRHVLVEVGETVGDYTVSAISADEVTLVGKDMPVEIALYAAKHKAKPIAKAAPKPADPYTEAVAETEAPADPYADDAEAAPPLVEGEDEPRIVSAHDGTEQAAEQAVENTIRATQWGTSKPHAERSLEIDGAKSTTSPFAGMSADAAKPSEDVANAGKPEPKGNGPAQLSKQEVSAALTDFAKLAASIDGSFGATGLVLEKIQAGSVFAKAGLVAGDVVTAIDGKPLKSIDDAADLYARAGGMKSATVQIVRGGKPHTLRIAIQ